MKKKMFFMSVMLMGCLSFFTSCVDGDYYDLYEDEGVPILPRNKKGKESIYPLAESISKLMQAEGNENGWYYAECAACCYSRFTGEGRFDTRVDLVIAQYGVCNSESCSLYLTGVMNEMPGFLISPGAFARALGWQLKSVVDATNAMHYGSIDWDHLAVIIDGNSHIAAVTGYSIKYLENNSGEEYTLTYTDHKGTWQCGVVWCNGEVYQDNNICQFVTR